MYPILFQLFGRDVSSWAVFALCGLWVCYWTISSALRVKKIPKRQIQIFMIGAVIVWYVGARWGQVLTVGDFSAAERVSLPNSKISAAGLVLYGGAVAVSIYSILPWWIFKWSKKFSFFELMDFGILGLSWANFFGRLGCTFYGCCYGSPSGKWPGYYLNYEHWDHPAMKFPVQLLGVKLHPAPFYEAVGILGILGIAYTLRAQKGRTWPDGFICFVCILLYGIIRFFLEFIRMDDRGELSLGLSPSQWFAIASSVISIGLIFWVIPKKPIRNQAMK